MDKESLNIIHANINSIVTNERRFILLKLIQEQNPDIVLLNETKLKPQHKPKFKNYDIIRNDRARFNGGGVAILINNKLKYTQIKLTNALIVNEVIIINIILKNNNNFYISCCYAAGAQATSFVSEIDYIFDSLKLEQPNNYFILAGDLNTKH